MRIPPQARDWGWSSDYWHADQDEPEPSWFEIALRLGIGAVIGVALVLILFWR